MGLCSETPISQVVKGNLYTEKQVRAMWYDWFCSEKALPNKGRSLLTKLKSIYPSPRFDGDKTYVFFKNNCPVQGKLYDDFRICSIGSGDVLYCVVPIERYNWSYGPSVVWGHHPVTGEFGELVRGTWSEIKAFFKGDDSLIEPTQRWNMIELAERENKYMKLSASHDAQGFINSDIEYREQLSHLLGVEL